MVCKRHSQLSLPRHAYFHGQYREAIFYMTDATTSRRKSPLSFMLFDATLMSPPTLALYIMLGAFSMLASAAPLRFLP